MVHIFSDTVCVALQSPLAVAVAADFALGCQLEAHNSATIYDCV